MPQLTLALPDEICDALMQRARVVGRSTPDELEQILRSALSIPDAAALPMALRDELMAMTWLCDDVLWLIAGSMLSPAEHVRYDALLDDVQSAAPSAERVAELGLLRDKAEALMLRKAHAFALLKERGHALPAIEDLPIPFPYQTPAGVASERAPLTETRRGADVKGGQHDSDTPSGARPD